MIWGCAWYEPRGCYDIEGSGSGIWAFGWEGGDCELAFVAGVVWDWVLLFCTVVCTVLCTTIMVWGGIDDEQRGRCPLECSGQYGICAFLDITTPFCVLIANILQNYLVIATIASAQSNLLVFIYSSVQDTCFFFQVPYFNIWKCNEHLTLSVAKV